MIKITDKPQDVRTEMRVNIPFVLILATTYDPFVLEAPDSSMDVWER